VKFLLLILILSKVEAAIFTTELVSVTETIGVGTDNLPLPGSDWVVDYSLPYSIGCDDYNIPSGYYYGSNSSMRDSAFLKTVSWLDIIDYIPSSSTCSVSASSVLDPIRLAVWADVGLIRQQSFGSSLVHCGGNTTCKDVTVTKTFQDQIIDTLTPTTGLSGNTAATFNAFLYNYASSSVNINDGTAGTGGLADLVVPTSDIKYCYIKKDLASDGIGSTYASVPFLDLFIINWKTISQGNSIPNSSLNGLSAGRASILKGIDDSQLRFIYNDNLLPGL
jgi:hypothetical protein